MLDEVQSVRLVNPILERLISLCAGMTYANAHVHTRNVHPSVGLGVYLCRNPVCRSSWCRVLLFSARFSHEDMDVFPCASSKCVCLLIFILPI